VLDESQERTVACGGVEVPISHLSAVSRVLALQRQDDRPRAPSSPSHTRALLRRTRRCSSCIVTSMSVVLSLKKRGDAPEANAGHADAVIEGVVRDVDGGHGRKCRTLRSARMQTVLYREPWRQRTSR
jgi:hypothetical protein